MKHIKKILLLCLLIGITIFPTKVNALEDNETTTYEYFEDGSYFEIVIIETTNITRSNNKSGEKIGYYRDQNGKIMWSVTVHGKFSYDGKTSKCTASTVSTSVNNNSWKIVKKNASISGVTATANATGNYYVNNKVNKSVTKTISLKCSATGKLS